jgi:hypothetical protein
MADRPARSAAEPVENELEVTPEMVEAGIRVLYDSGAIENPALGVDRELVRQIFLAMLE